MSAQLLRDYQNGDRAPVLGPLTYAECQAMADEIDRLLESAHALRLALAATQQGGSKRKTDKRNPDAKFVMTPAMMDLGDRLLAIQGETAHV